MYAQQGIYVKDTLPQLSANLLYEEIHTDFDGSISCSSEQTLVSVIKSQARDLFLRMRIAESQGSGTGFNIPN